MVLRVVKQEADAKDVTQNVFIKVFQKLDTFNQKSALYTWLHRIATNESLNYLNSRKRKQVENLDNTQTQHLLASLHADGDKIEKILADAIETLPDRQRQVFELRYYDEMMYSEIVETLGGSEGAMKASYHHAVKKIEAFIKKQEFFDQ